MPKLSLRRLTRWHKADVLDYSLVGAVILVSGSLYYSTLLNNVWLLVIMGVAALRLASSRIRRSQLTTPVLFSLLAMLIISLNSGVLLTSWAVFLARTALAIIIVLCIPFGRFVEIFIKVVTFLAAASLLYLPLVPLGVRSPLPTLETLIDWPFDNFILFAINSEYYAQSIMRNSGIFWEPGAFQFFINMALLLGVIYSRLDRTTVAILLITLATTQSTTGYLVALLTLPIVLAKQGVQIKVKSLIQKTAALGLLGTCLLVLGRPILEETVFKKLSFESLSADPMSNISLVSRVNDHILDWVIFSGNILNGVGYGNLSMRDTVGPALFGVVYDLIPPTGADGLLLLLAQVGILGILLLVPLLFPRFLADLSFTSRLMYCLAMILLYSTENFTAYLIFNVMLLYGVQKSTSSGDPQPIAQPLRGKPA